MPLSAPAERKPLHDRTIVLRGYERTDGLFDVEAQLTDLKHHGFENSDRGWIAPGVPLHGMWARFTLDETLVIVEAEASTDYGPYSICGGGADSFKNLAGLKIGPGFLKAARERVGGTTGCTHLRELLQQMATVAMQSLYPVRARLAAAAAGSTSRKTEGSPALINTCYGYSSDGEPVRRRWPHLYTGPDGGAGQEAKAAVLQP